MDTRKRAVVFAAAAALAGSLAIAPVASAAPAPRAGDIATPQAADPPRDCPKEYLCVYPKSKWRGDVQKVKRDNRKLRQYGGAFNNPESVYNNGRYCDVYVYTKTNFGGHRYRLNKGTGWRFVSRQPEHIWSNQWYCHG